MAEQDSSEASKKYKEVHNKSASEHNLEFGDNMLIDNQLYCSQEQKVFNNVDSTFCDFKNHKQTKHGIEKKITSLQGVLT